MSCSALMVWLPGENWIWFLNQWWWMGKVVFDPLFFCVDFSNGYTELILYVSTACFLEEHRPQ